MRVRARKLERTLSIFFSLSHSHSHLHIKQIPQDQTDLRDFVFEMKGRNENIYSGILKINSSTGVFNSTFVIAISFIYCPPAKLNIVLKGIVYPSVCLKSE